MDKEPIDIPKPTISAWKKAIISDLNQSDRAASELEYARLISVISDPVTCAIGLKIRGYRTLQTWLYIVIQCRRCVWPLYILAIVGAVWLSWWFALAIPVIWLLGSYVLNMVQTNLNIALGARFFAYEDLMESDMSE